MILAFHPTHPEIPGETQPVPANWLRYISPWSKVVFRQSEFGSTLIQELLTEEFGIYSWRLEVTDTVRLYPSAEIPTIALQFMLEGNIPCKLSGFGDKLLEKDRQEMFYVPIGFNEAWFEPGTYESLHVELKPRYLEELIGIRPEIKELVSRLQTLSNRGMPMAVAGIHYTTRAILQNLKSCDKKGALLQLEMHKYILELLCEYLEGIRRKEEDQQRMHIPHRELILRVKDHILSAPNVFEHTPKKLARRFGISESVLRRVFRAYAGIPISAYIRAETLARGEYLLTATSRTIDDIADLLGYGWRQSFGDAFKKQYHYSPNDWRNAQDSSKI